MQVRCQNSSRCRAGESTDDDSEFNYIRVRQIVKKIIYGVKFIWISIGNLDPTIIFVILEWLLLVYWSRSISLVFLRGSPLDRRNSYRHWWWTIQWLSPGLNQDSIQQSLLEVCNVDCQYLSNLCSPSPRSIFLNGRLPWAPQKD